MNTPDMTLATEWLKQQKERCLNTHRTPAGQQWWQSLRSLNIILTYKAVAIGLPHARLQDSHISAENQRALLDAAGKETRISISELNNPHTGLLDLWAVGLPTDGSLFNPQPISEP